MAYADKVEENVIAEASWNIARGFVEEIQKSIQKATIMFQRDDYYGAFKSLHSTRLRIVQYLNSEERARAKKLEAGLMSIIGKIQAIEEPEDHRKAYLILSRQVVLLYDGYNEFLMDMIKKYKLGIPDKEYDEGMF